MYNKIVRQDAIKLGFQGLKQKVTEAGLSNVWRLNTTATSLIMECEFKDYESTWGFLSQVAMRSHLWGHHPKITTCYNKVKLELTTHDLLKEGKQYDGLSDIDLKMAKRIEKYISMYRE